MTQAMPLTNKIDESSSKTSSYKAIISKFGDGFSQRAPNGINTKIDSWTVNWSPLLITDRNTVVTALDAVGTWGIITWTPPGETVSKKFIVTSGYSESYISNYYRISVKLEQVFDV